MQTAADIHAGTRSAIHGRAGPAAQHTTTTTAHSSADHDSKAAAGRRVSEQLAGSAARRRLELRALRVRALGGLGLVGCSRSTPARSQPSTRCSEPGSLAGSLAGRLRHGPALVAQVSSCPESLELASHHRGRDAPSRLIRPVRLAFGCLFETPSLHSQCISKAN